jgi:CheY-like chemotaxis protein
MRILVVDDEEDSRELLRALLESQGVTVDAASSAGEALLKLQNLPVDLLISDIGMPGEDGYALVRHLRGLPLQSKANIPAIALTAFVRREDRERALREGFDAHLGKPIDFPALLSLVARLSLKTVKQPNSG